MAFDRGTFIHDVSVIIVVSLRIQYRCFKVVYGSEL